MSTGFRVYMKRQLPPKDLVKKFKKLPTANVSDCMGRMSALNSEIRLMTKPFKGSMAGPALTVKARPGDNLMIHKALNMAQEGDIIIVANSGDRSHSLIGEIMAGFALHKKVAGFVFDGPIRDVEALYDLGVPVYATGSTPDGPYKDGPGEINAPISCGDIRVNPGDIVMGDQDGVIIVPRQDAERLYKEAKKISASDKARLEAAKKGTADRSWVDKTLKEKGCEIIDDYCK